jgi:hypothetical protein
MAQLVVVVICHSNLGYFYFLFLMHVINTYYD